MFLMLRAVTCRLQGHKVTSVTSAFLATPNSNGSAIPTNVTTKRHSAVNKTVSIDGYFTVNM